jgi:SAM-dependent methyltransferase
MVREAESEDVRRCLRSRRGRSREGLIHRFQVESDEGCKTGGIEQGMDRAVYDRMRMLQAVHWWFTGRRAVLTRLLASLNLPAEAKILEAGCGPGGNIAMLQAFGEVSVMEPDGPCREDVRSRFGLEAADGRLPSDLPWPPGSFDLVCAFDVIEHVDEDQAAVTALAARVKSSGFLVLTVPAFGWLWSAHDEAHHHKRRYGRKDITAIAEMAGLKVVKASYFNTFLFPVAVAVRLVSRVLGLSVAEDALPRPAVNRLLGRIFAAEAGPVAAGSLPFGLSIVVVGQRP